MENCLKTTLKSAVQNDTLSKLGVIVIKVHAVSGSGPIKIQLKRVSKATLVSGTAHFTNSTGTENYGSEVTSGSGIGVTYGEFYVTNVDCTIEVSLKYDILSFISNKKHFMEVNPSDLNYMGANIPEESLSVLLVPASDYKYINNTNIKYRLYADALLYNPNGDAVDMSLVFNRFETINAVAKVSNISISEQPISNPQSINAFTEVTNLNLFIATCSSNILLKDLAGNLTKITSLSLQASAFVRGSLEDFLDLQKNNRSNGDTIAFRSNSKITYGGVAFADNTQKTITFDGQGGYTVS